MAEGTDKDQKTHEPTEKKLQDARRKGDTFTAPEARHAVMFVGILAILGGVGMSMVRAMGDIAMSLWGGADDIVLDPAGAQRFATALLARTAYAVGPVLAVLVALACLTMFLQGRPSLSWSRIKPKWSKLSPFSGAKRLFGPRAFAEFGKTLVKFFVVALIVWMVAAPRLSGLDHMVGMTPASLAAATIALIFAMVKAVAMLVAALALFDFVFQRRAYMSRMRMSLQELKDEHKESEGDPKIKAKLRSIAIQRSRRRMMAKVPEASVIITNPTHFAVALKYEHGAMRAPVVVAKGTDAVALRIRDVAKGANVPIVENPPLARALYAAVEVDHPIPVEHYTAVAEIIGFVLRLSRQRQAPSATL